MKRAIKVPYSTYEWWSFPGLFLNVYIESPNHKNPRWPHTTRPKPHELKAPTPKPRTPNHYKRAKMRKNVKNNPGKNYGVQNFKHGHDLSVIKSKYPPKIPANNQKTTSTAFIFLDQVFNFFREFL